MSLYINAVLRKLILRQYFAPNDRPRPQCGRPESLCAIHKEVQTETERKHRVGVLQAKLAEDFGKVEATHTCGGSRFETRRVTPKPIVDKVAQDKRFKFSKKFKHHKCTDGW